MKTFSFDNDVHDLCSRNDNATDIIEPTQTLTKTSPLDDAVHDLFSRNDNVTDIIVSTQTFTNFQ
jgi:hypothetical protein